MCQDKIGVKFLHNFRFKKIVQKIVIKIKSKGHSKVSNFILSSMGLHYFEMTCSYLSPLLTINNSGTGSVPGWCVPILCTPECKAELPAK